MSVEQMSAMVKKTYHCDRCRDPFFRDICTKWRSETLCPDCIKASPDIKQARASMRIFGNYYLLLANQNKCEMCAKEILYFDSHNHPIERANFNMDHINSLQKKDSSRSVGSMSLRGCLVDDILEEMRKCRVLCLSCHSAVTAVELHLGVHRLKNAGFSDEKQDSIRLQVDYFAKKLLILQKRKLLQENIEKTEVDQCVMCDEPFDENSEQNLSMCNICKKQCCEICSDAHSCIFCQEVTCEQHIKECQICQTLKCESCLLMCCDDKITKKQRVV